MINVNTAFGHDLFDLAKTQWLCHLPANAGEHHGKRIRQAVENGAQRHVHQWNLVKLPITIPRDHLMRQNHYSYLYLDNFSRKIMAWQVY